MKKIEDYLHLYLGCEMEYATHHEPQSETYKLTHNNLYQALEFGDRPILRELSSMTEEECDECNKLAATLFTMADLQNQIRQEAATTKYLLSKGFDLFGLIESGLAISAPNPINEHS